jgi:hypothetical protein
MKEHFIAAIATDLRTAAKNGYEIVFYENGLEILLKTGELAHERRRLKSWTLSLDGRNLTGLTILESSEMETCSITILGRMSWKDILSEARR